jgi:hypothetical protein
MQQRTSRVGKATTKYHCRASQGIQRQARCGEGAGGLELVPIVPYVGGLSAAAAQAAAIALDSFCG